MMPELIILLVVLVLSVLAHFFFWRDSKKRYDACLKQAQAINEQLRRLEENDSEIDGMLDEAEEEVQKMGDEIDALRAVRFLNKKKGTLEN